MRKGSFKEVLVLELTEAVAAVVKSAVAFARSAERSWVLRSDLHRLSDLRSGCVYGWINAVAECSGSSILVNS
ncbi:hypothetical protein Ancab_000232 [Ancistrocladus abbreviatus]